MRRGRVRQRGRWLEWKMSKGEDEQREGKKEGVGVSQISSREEGDCREDGKRRRWAEGKMCRGKGRAGKGKQEKVK